MLLSKHKFKKLYYFIHHYQFETDNNTYRVVAPQVVEWRGGGGHYFMKEKYKKGLRFFMGSNNIRAGEGGGGFGITHKNTLHRFKRISPSPKLCFFYYILLYFLFYPFYFLVLFVKEGCIQYKKKLSITHCN